MARTNRTVLEILEVVGLAQEAHEKSWVNPPPHVSELGKSGGYTLHIRDAVKQVGLEKGWDLVTDEVSFDLASFLISQAWNESQDWLHSLKP